MRSVTTPTAEFCDLTRALYGDQVDTEVLWAEVSKMNPDPSSVHVMGVRPTGRKRRIVKRDVVRDKSDDGKLQRRVAVASNLLGLTAGGAAIGSTLRDDRLATGGKTARRVYAVGQKIPKPIQDATKHVSRRTAGKLALGAAALQGANVAGDIVVSQTLPKTETSKADVPLSRLVTGRLTGLRRQSAVSLNPTRPPRVPGAPIPKNPNAKPKAAKPASGTDAKAAKPAPRVPLRVAPTGAPPARPSLAQRAETRFAARTGENAPGARAPIRIQPTGAPAAPAPTPVAGPGAKPAAQVTPAFTPILDTPRGKATALAATGGAGLYAGNRQGKNSAYASMSPYAKADVSDVEFGGTFSKFDDDKRLAFGWASVVAMNGQPVVDRQGDYIAIDDIEEAAYTYVEKSRVGGDMHRRAAGNLGSDIGKEDRPHKVGELVESMVFTPEKISKMGLPADFPVGWWVGYKIHDDEAWGEVKKGNRTGFSIHGKGLRKEVDYDSILETT